MICKRNKLQIAIASLHLDKTPPFKIRQNMFVNHMPRAGLISKRQQSYKANISRAITPAKFAEHILSPQMHI